MVLHRQPSAGDGGAVGRSSIASSRAVRHARDPGHRVPDRALPDPVPRDAAAHAPRSWRVRAVPVSAGARADGGDLEGLPDGRASSCSASPRCFDRAPLGARCSALVSRSASRPRCATTRSPRRCRSIVLLFEWRAGQRWLARYAIALGAWLAVTVVALGINALLTDRKMHFWHSSLALADIVGTLGICRRGPAGQRAASPPRADRDPRRYEHSHRAIRAQYKSVTIPAARSAAIARSGTCSVRDQSAPEHRSATRSARAWLAA